MILKSKEKDKKKDKDEEPFLKSGGRNLLILTGICVIFAIATTSLSLFIYRKTGDVYLDRSRPGYISEGEEKPENQSVKPTFDDDGPINEEQLDLYLKELESAKKNIDDSKDGFSSTPLSNNSLGIGQ
jgi:hypothetical protein